MKIAFGADHAGYELARSLEAVAQELGHHTSWHGADGTGAFDYPDAAREAACEVAEGRAQAAVLVCGTGIGMSIAANRDPRIRAAVCWSAETARLAREHNGANVLCLGSRLLGFPEAREAFQTFLEASEDDSDRHARRRQKLTMSADCR